MFTKSKTSDASDDTNLTPFAQRGMLDELDAVY